MKENTSHNFAAILPAGGLGKRLGADTPKQLLTLGEKAMYKHSLDLFWNEPRIAQVVLAVPKEWQDFFIKDLRNYDANRLTIVEGGAERWQSVRHGIEALESHIEYALVHDVARPFLSAEILQAVLKKVQKEACIVAKPCVDTVKIVRKQNIVETIDRNLVWLAQTPQAARGDLLKKLYVRMDGDALDWNPTDEASILEHYGVAVGIVPGNTLNDKITTAEDLELFRKRLSYE